MATKEEMAKELKEWGYPQRDLISRQVFRTKGERANVVFVPTIEDLIDDCGGDAVIVLTVGRSLSTALNGATGMTSSGATPFEALKNLWLATKKI